MEYNFMSKFIPAKDFVKNKHVMMEINILTCKTFILRVIMTLKNLSFFFTSDIHQLQSMNHINECPFLLTKSVYIYIRNHEYLGMTHNRCYH